MLNTLKSNQKGGEVMKKKIFFRKSLSIVLLFTLVIVSLTSNGVIMKDLENESGAIKSKKNDEYIVVTKDKKGYEKIKNEYGKYIVNCYDEYDVKGNILTADISEEQVEMMERDKNIIAVEKDIKVMASGLSNETSTEAVEDWNIKMISADDEIVKESIDKEKVKVAVIDSGVDALSDVNVKERINLVDKNTSIMFEDYSGHGTNVAGIIVNEELGINPNVEIYSAKVLDDKNTAPISRVVEGIYWAVEQDVDIINLSFGTKQYSKALETAIKTAYSKGIILIGAAGNGGDTVEYPAAFDEVIAVGSVDAEGKVSEKSTVGAEVDLMAPGECVKTTSAFGGTTFTSGSSMAVPHVTAMASILLQKDMSATNDFIKALMCASAKSLGVEGTGSGVIDIGYALENYDEFKRLYSAEKVVEFEQNTEELETFDDSNFVEGRWSKEDHRTIVQYGYDEGTFALDDWELNRIKYGAYNIDIIFPSHYGQEDDSSFLHGYKNYVANYRYLTYASKFIEKNGVAALMKDTYKVAGARESDIKDRINNFPWPEYADSKHEKALIVFGLALHTAADAYAHKAYGLINGTYQNIDHVQSNYSIHADNITYFSDRYEGSKIMTKKAFNRYFGTDGYGTYNQFVHNHYNQYKLHKLYSYCSKVAASYGGSISGNATLLKNASYGD